MTALTPRERFRRAPESLLLYAVSDDAWLGERTLASCCAQAVRGGATFLQLRAKRATTEELISAYAEIRDELEREGLAGKVPFVIDDDVEAALAVGADGVHVGQSDESCASARARLGEGAIVGVSAPNGGASSCRAGCRCRLFGRGGVVQDSNQARGGRCVSTHAAGNMCCREHSRGWHWGLECEYACVARPYGRAWRCGRVGDFCCGDIVSATQDLRRIMDGVDLLV